MKEWHYTAAGQQAGPVTREEIQGLLATGKITADTLVWKTGLVQWQPVRAFPEFVAAPPTPPPPTAPSIPAVPPFSATPPVAPVRGKFPLWLKIVLGLIGLGLVAFIIIFIATFLFVFSAAKELGVTPGTSGRSSSPAGLVDVNATAQATGVPVELMPATVGDFQRGFVKTFQKNGGTGVSVGYGSSSRPVQLRILNGMSDAGAQQLRDAFEAEYAGDATFKDGGAPLHLLKGFSKAQNAYIIIWTQGSHAFCVKLPDKESAQDFLLPYLQANLGQS